MVSRWQWDNNKRRCNTLRPIRSEKNECNKNIEARLENARRTKYALIGSGFHGTNGIDAVTSYRIYHTYVLPRLIYGLEVLPLKKKHVENLESFHRKSIRYLQSLPQRIATAAIYLLVGVIPIEAELHQRKLSLLYSMLASDNTKIKEIINKQIRVNYDNEDSFFCSIRDILILYDLPSITSKITIKNQLEKTCKKRGWTSLVEKTPEWCHCQDYLKIFGHKTSRSWDKPPLMEDEIKNKNCGEEIDNKS
jgi:hypothetical protein